MAVVAQGAVLVADGFDMSCHFRSMEVKSSVDMHDTTVLCTTGARAFQPGLVERTLTAEGFFAYNSAADTQSLDRQFSESLSTTAHKVISIGEDGGSVGDPAYLFGAKTTSFGINEVVGDLIMLNFEAKATNGTNPAYGFAAAGHWLAYQTVTGTVNNASVDTTSGGTGYLAHAHCTAANMSNMTVKIQHSSNNSTWADLLTFTSFTGVGAQQLGSTVTSVNRYVRAIVSVFTGTSAHLAVAIKVGYSG